MQEEEFVDIVKEIQNDSMLKNVRLFVVMEEFKQYQKGNQINAQQFKTSLKKVIMSETEKNVGKALTPNEVLKIDSISKRLLKIFDTNKNGKLEY